MKQIIQLEAIGMVLQKGDVIRLESHTPPFEIEYWQVKSVHNTPTQFVEGMVLVEVERLTTSEIRTPAVLLLPNRQYTVVPYRESKGVGA